MLRRECLSWFGVSLGLSLIADTPVPLWASPSSPTPQRPLHLPDVKFVPTPPAVVPRCSGWPPCRRAMCSTI